ncbi:hypothetical protein GCM10022235_00330 [Kribbella ginsengisoli]|uniref:Lipoprotein n=2 Tax=Kribbella ginsengisoli TaxID=363865 RepID=A0ABP6VN60_9ACTN
MQVLAKTALGTVLVALVAGCGYGSDEPDRPAPHKVADRAPVTPVDGPPPGRPIATYEGQGNDSIETPVLENPWHIAWEFDCGGSSGKFTVTDSLMGNLAPIARTGPGQSGTFDQFASAGSRTLTVITTCNWSMSLYQE